MKKILFILIPTLFYALCSCTTTHEIVMGDVISFGDSAITNYYYRKGLFKNISPQGDPYVIYNQGVRKSAEEFKMKAQIQKTRMENNTAGIYAMDLGLDRIKYIRKHQLKHDPNTHYYIIYMTDGLDNISCQVAKNNKQGRYKTPDKYKEKMKKKITKVSRYKKKSQNPFDIYPVVFTGSDLGDVKRDNHMSDAEFNKFITQNMDWLRGSSRGPENAPKIIEANDFEKVKEIFRDEFNASGFEFHVPKGYAGKGIRMVFEDENHVKTELTGSLVKKGGKYYLRGISLKNGLETGIKSKNGKELELVALNNKDKKADLAIFRLEKPKYKGKSYFIVKEGVSQFVNEGGLWVKNSEYISQSTSAIDTYFILIFDASTSLKREGFAKEKETAIDMINTISGGIVERANKVDIIEN